MEHEREHTGQLTQAAPRKPRVPARTKFPTPRPCGPPNFSVTILVDRSRVVGTRQIRLQSLQRNLSRDLSSLFTHSPNGTLPLRMGESCDWDHRNYRKQQCEPVCAARDHAHAGNGLAQLGYKVNAGRVPRCVVTAFTASNRGRRRLVTAAKKCSSSL